jgi:uncharacterized membrane protein
MIPRWTWELRLVLRRLGVRAALFSLLAVVAALVGAWLGPYIPPRWVDAFGADAVEQLLQIIASSMLAVTTFSLSVMVAAYAAITNSVTPRATKLLAEDSTTQNALATFLGSFLFSLVGLIGISAGLYQAQGRLVLFAATIAVIAIIVIVLLRWIDHLSRLGRVGETTQQVERAVRTALEQRRRQPGLGALCRSDEAVPIAARRVHFDTVGYVCHIDLGALDTLAGRAGGLVHVLADPGSFVTPGDAVLAVEGLGIEFDTPLCAAFSFGDRRSFDQDPRFGLSVMAEIASRALSPAVNDPGTAIDVIGRIVRLLVEWQQPLGTEPAAVRYPRVTLPPVRIADAFDDVFHPIARDGAALAETAIRLQKALDALARHNPAAFAEPSRRHARFALDRAEHALRSDEDRRRVREAAVLVPEVNRQAASDAADASPPISASK